MSAHQEREAFEAHTGYDWDDPYPLAAQARVLWSAAWGAAMAPAGEPVARSARRVSVDSGAIAMVLNALRRDATEGKASRQEMVDELEATISPAIDRSEVLRLADEMARKAWASASSFDRRMQDEARKYEEDEKASRAALVRLLGVE